MKANKPTITTHNSASCNNSQLDNSPIANKINKAFRAMLIDREEPVASTGAHNRDKTS